LMVSQVCSLEIITTSTEVEALLLESTLIKSFKPKYNILLKDDKSFPYIVIRKDHRFSQILKYRGNKNEKKNLYFGPFLSNQAVKDTIEVMQKVFKLRSCSDSFFSSRRRPCLLYQIKKCSAPCVGYISEHEYSASIKQAIEFLEGKNKKIQKEFASAMANASEKMEYEKAAEYRDKIKALNMIQMKSDVIDIASNLDVIAIDRDLGSDCIQVFVYRDGQNLGNKSYFFDNTQDVTVEEVLASFICQFYQNNVKPDSIICSHAPTDNEMIEKAFNLKILVPRSGKKYRIAEFALNNAISANQRKNLSKQRHIEILSALAKVLEINNQIKKIEVFDNSHISGQYAVGAMIVAGEEGFLKKYYRLFNIELSKVGDDYSMMKEVLTRRYSKLLRNAEEYENKPDLVIIDGGPGQLSITRQVFKELCIDIPFISIAKGEKRNAGGEIIYCCDGSILKLSNDNMVMQFLQNLRDEAHRFAIKSHRIKRKKSINTSLLDNIPNIGEKRRKLLLQHFGGIKEIKDATVKQISEVEGIGFTRAQEIFDYFKKD
jgi:excinuclease ABC subunit C